MRFSCHLRQWSVFGARDERFGLSGLIVANVMLAGRKQEIHVERDRRLEESFAPSPTPTPPGGIRRSTLAGLEFLVHLFLLRILRELEWHG